jgi:hypothetical protein
MSDGRRRRMEEDDGWKKQIRFSPDSGSPLIRGPLSFVVSFDSLEQICSPSSLPVFLSPFRTFCMLNGVTALDRAKDPLPSGSLRSHCGSSKHGSHWRGHVPVDQT